MRKLLVGLLLFSAVAVRAQLQPAPLTEIPRLERSHSVGEAPPPLLALFSDVGLAIPTAPRFDFAATKPHLAFFCRLEINEAAGGAIPLKFRLGEVRGWQQEVGRR